MIKVETSNKPGLIHTEINTRDEVTLLPKILKTWNTRRNKNQNVYNYRRTP